MEVLKLVLTKFTDETITVFGLLLLTSLCMFVILWLINRKRFHDLGHQIPASVVKNYLDTIIQNSNSLKSSLFRGGGLDVSGVPSVFPLGGLPSSGVDVKGPSSEELNQKNAEIALLNNKILDRDKMLRDLEKRLLDLQNAKGGEETKIFQEEIKKLQERLAKADADLQAAKASAGAPAGDPEAQKKLDTVTKERDDLKERLAEYEIIEEDLANLKRLQQENEQLRKSLAALQGGGAAVATAAAVAAPVVAAAPAPTPAPTPVAAAAPAPAPEEDLEAAMAAAIAESAPKAAAAAPAPAAAPAEAAVPPVVDEQKSAEELLSEFEKMLG